MPKFRSVDRDAVYLEEQAARPTKSGGYMADAKPFFPGTGQAVKNAEGEYPSSTADAAVTSRESDDAAAARLAALSEFEYDRVRKRASEELGVQLSTLDALIKGKRKIKQESNDGWFETIDPWHEAVDPAVLFDEIVQIIRRFIVCDVETARVAAMWAVMTYIMDVINTAPIAMITAPEKGSGKTQFLSVLGKLSLRAMPVSGISAAALFRIIEVHQPTMLIDETDTFLADNEELRMVLNAGHTRDSAFVVRCTGDDHEPKKFNVYGAKALSGINNKGKLHPTLIDRSIILELRKKLPSEPVSKLNRHSDKEFRTLRAKLARYALDHGESIGNAQPAMPVEFDGRLEDNWEPLFAIADTAGAMWSDRVRQAALKISAAGSQPSLGAELLADIHEIFESKGVSKIHTADLFAALCEDEDKPWATHNRGKSISPRQIGNMLGSYGIQSRQIRINFNNKKGYCREDFEDAFARYVFPPDHDFSGETKKQPSIHAALLVSDEQNVSLANETGPTRETEKSSVYAGCSAVSLETARSGIKGALAISTPNGQDDDVIEVDL